jgi:hypothetical protein
MDLTPKYKRGDRVRVTHGDYTGKMGRIVQTHEGMRGYTYYSIRFDGCKTPKWFKHDAVLELVNPLDRLSGIK